MFNSQERTLRELAALTLKSGWKITQVTRAEGSIFGHIIAVPVDIPPETLAQPMCDEPEADQESTAHSQSLFLLIPRLSADIDRPGEVDELNVLGPAMPGTFLASTFLPSEDVMKAGVARGKNGMGGSASEPGAPAPKRRGGRERASTFTGSRSAPKNESKGGSSPEARKGWRSIVKMLSRPQLRGGAQASSASGGSGSDSKAPGDVYALTRQPSKG